MANHPQLTGKRKQRGTSGGGGVKDIYQAMTAAIKQTLGEFELLDKNNEASINQGSQNISE